ncbi:MAG TPA: hypothetical protein VFP12_11520 [Allosphingosinicella sp.]|nr:hypothetical protein [Allosphingosinicella sp.]
MTVLANGLLAAAALAGAEPASSAVDIGTLHVVADCMVDRYRPGVRRLLALDYRSRAYNSALQTLSREGSRCAPFAFGKLRSAGVLMAGAFAEKLLPGALNGSRLADRVAFDPTAPAVPARDDGEYLALCAVRTMPEEVAGLLATRPASEAERLAVGGLRPRLGPCLRAGAAARINIPGLRAILALAAYRLVSQQSPRASLSFEGSSGNG